MSDGVVFSCLETICVTRKKQAAADARRLARRGTWKKRNERLRKSADGTVSRRVYHGPSGTNERKPQYRYAKVQLRDV